MRKPRSGDFKEGNPGGPGRPALPDEIKEANQYTRSQLIGAITKYVVMPLEDLRKLAVDQSLPAIDHMIMRIIMNSISKGDQTRLDFLLDRIQGKVKQVVENIGDRPRVDSERLNELHERLVMLIMADKMIKDTPVVEEKEATGLIPGNT
jgi:hypothetical protein